MAKKKKDNKISLYKVRVKKQDSSTIFRIILGHNIQVNCKNQIKYY